ncbi:2-hydroxychromene-2-carboxylate isomerase [Ascidiaceihabitans donghaensis]|uniref:2-hydroxychromene-2-carboxylate isomerase n=1 Tax=Ascidiaceihabitans donghaensis TaxID=1510460 RepID=A0A2R8BAV1_9RHOB|nr:2-hydroxychromene-2-carboxylate isomerase [Ascidiaceihabitans donghaensis]SPH20193.1 2-hydroxychromene-2-carboxylate isomerase [Ascidiaceihabitans donghaensis]
MTEIEYFYSAHSAFAYIGSSRLMEICAKHGASLVHRPIALSPVVEAAGGLSFAGRTRPHVDYYFGREIERWSEFRNVSIINHRPTYHDNALDLSNGMIIASIPLDVDTDALAHAILQAHWRDDIDLADVGALMDVAQDLGLDGRALLDAAQGDDVRGQHEANTQEAIARNVFGSPTYFVGGDMFYGQDHLELVARALEKPFEPNAFRNPE